MNLPLSGITVVDLTRALAGPYCTALLGDLGAEVVKVEGLPRGDATRAWPPMDSGRSLYYLSTNRNKRSIALDFRTDEGKMILGDLVARADVLVENFRPGVLPLLGLDPQELRVSRPDLVIASVSGFGEVGPLATAAGLDQVAQGMSGLMSVTGAGEHTPMRFGVPVTDVTAGIFTAFGVVSSLLGRADTGRAARVNTSLLESAISLMVFQAQGYLSTGDVPVAQGNDHPIISPYGTFQAADGPMNVAVGSDAHWRSLWDILDAPEMADDARFAVPELRTRNRAELTRELNRRFAQNTTTHWLDRLREAGIPVGPIYSVDQVFDDVQVRALGVVQTPQTGAHRDRLLRGPLWVDGERSAIHRHPPALGEHTEEILNELGYDREHIDSLIARGIAGGAG